MSIRSALYLLAAPSLISSNALAGIAFTNDLSSATGFSIAGDADTQATFGYDYSADGIPSAPNGSGTVGLKLEANITAGAAAEIAAVTSLGFSGTQYRVSFDMWSNFSLSDGSSTEFIGGSIGHDGVTPGRNGATMIATGDGGSSRDFRLYKNKGEQFFASLQYGPSLSSNNGTDPVLSAAFPGQAAPATQGQSGTSDAGDTAFGWITMQIDVDPFATLQGSTGDLGTAMFTMISHTSGNSVVIGTVDNSNGGEVVAMEGGFGFVYADLFSSLAGDPQLQFGIFDNLVVETIPEPSSSLLIALAGTALLLRRRR